MKTLSAFGAVLAASAVVAIPATSADAGTVNITGSPYTGFVGYGTSISKNNVVDFAPSGLSDPTNGKSWIGGGSVLSNVNYYTVDWYFNGAESGDTIKFSTVGLPSFSENNQNNNYNFGNDPGWKFLGTTSGSGNGSPIPFAVTDLNYGISVANGSNHAPTSSTSLIFSYVIPEYKHGHFKGWELTTTATDWVVFGFDDPGGTDKDFDDYMGLLHVKVAEGPPPPKPTPLPGALPLMGTVLGAGFFFRRWRGSRSPAAA